MFRRDRNKHDTGIIFYINENIPCKIVNVEGLPVDCEVTLIHGFTISVRVFILRVFRQLLLRNGKISSNCLF